MCSYVHSSVTSIMIDISGHLAPPNLPPGQTLNGVNLKRALGQSKYIYVLPSRKLKDVAIPETYYVSLNQLQLSVPMCCPFTKTLVLVIVIALLAYDNIATSSINNLICIGDFAQRY